MYNIYPWHKVRKKKKKPGRMECEQCDFTTTGKKKYKDHIQTVHGVVIRCDTCKYTTTKEIYLKRHKMRCDGIVERQKRSEAGIYIVYSDHFPPPSFEIQFFSPKNKFAAGGANFF